MTITNDCQICASVKPSKQAKYHQLELVSEGVHYCSISGTTEHSDWLCPECGARWKHYHDHGAGGFALSMSRVED